MAVVTTSDAMSGPCRTAIGAITLEDMTETMRVTQHHHVAVTWPSRGRHVAVTWPSGPLEDHLVELRKIDLVRIARCLLIGADIEPVFVCHGDAHVG
jgi:hypothetical protein